MFSWFKTLLLFIKLKAPKETTREINYGNFRNVEYVRNYDGDTITFNIPELHPLIGKGINIRIADIDTPEIKGGTEQSKELAYLAKLEVQKLLSTADEIDLVNCRRGKYFRIVADVFADNLNVGKLLLVKGLAIQYYGGTKIHNWSK